MKYCQHCGQEVHDNAVVCVHCGRSLETKPQVSSSEHDAPNTGFGVLSFFFPIVGLILFILWKDNTPLKAKSAGKGALAGVITSVIFGILWGIVIAVSSATAFAI